VSDLSTWALSARQTMGWAEDDQVQFQLESGPTSAWFTVQFQLEFAVFDM
jgi:hypothetical protein